jgi:hypothetical protein
MIALRLESFKQRLSVDSIVPSSVNSSERTETDLEQNC